MFKADPLDIGAERHPLDDDVVLAVAEGEPEVEAAQVEHVVEEVVAGQTEAQDVPVVGLHPGCKDWKGFDRC